MQKGFDGVASNASQDWDETGTETLQTEGRYAGSNRKLRSGIVSIVFVIPILFILLSVFARAEAAHAGDLQAMMVYDASMSSLVDDAVKTSGDVAALVETKGGNISGSSRSGEMKDLTVHLTVKIPRDQLFGLIKELKQVGEVVDEEVTGEDVAAEYADLKVQKNALDVMCAKFGKPYEKTGMFSRLFTDNEVIRQFEDKLNAVNERIRQIDSDAAFSTVEIFLSSSRQSLVSEHRKLHSKAKGTPDDYLANSAVSVRNLLRTPIFITVYVPLIIAIIILVFITCKVIAAKLK